MPSNDTGNCTIVTVTGAHLLDVRVASGFLSRFFGLMFRPAMRPAQGLLLMPCSSVHTVFMRASIDVVYLDRNGVVTKCMSNMKPWRGSFGDLGTDRQGRRFPRAAHALELAAGAIDTFCIAPGDRLDHPHWNQLKNAGAIRGLASEKQRGSSMIEFTIVGPVITMLGLTVLQYSMLFFAKSQINYASFMAAREGSVANADITSVRDAYVRALVPLYGGGQTPAELAASLAKATADLDASGHVNIELLNPTEESFADWNDPALQLALNTNGKRVIPNSGQAYKSQAVGAASGQTIQDANLIKLRITQGYAPKIPFVNKLYTTYLKWLDPHTDAFHSRMVNEGRIPIVTNVTMHMQSDAIEPGALVSSPGAGNGGTPVNPGPPPTPTTPPPDCSNTGCEIPPTTPETPPACNPFTDPHHCVPSTCTPSAEMCCMPLTGLP